MSGTTVRAALAVTGLLLVANNARSHSASDAYLTMTADASHAAGASVIHGQWDIALRDLDFVLKLDDDGDGKLSWGEVHAHQAAIEHYAYRYLDVTSGGRPCSIKPQRQLIDDHADGAYAALLFDVICAKRPSKISLRYSLFFKIDPSHRGIFVMNSGTNVATALFSPENGTIELPLSP